MITLDELREILEPMNIREVARGAGVHPNAIYRLIHKGSQPSYETVKKIVTYLESKGIVK